MLPVSDGRVYDAAEMSFLLFEQRIQYLHFSKKNVQSIAKHDSNFLTSLDVLFIIWVSFI